MSEVPICSIVIPSELSSDEIESLETSLSLSSVNVQKSLDRVLGVDDIVLVVTVISGVSAAAQLVDYSIKVAVAINNWRRKLREKRIEPQGKLKHPKRPYIDLGTATDQEIEAWFTQK